MWLRFAAINGFFAVAAGAFAAHALHDRLTERMLDTFATGARYHLYHALALLAIALMNRRRRTGAIVVAAWCFTFGIVLFSGSLYALALSELKWLGAITPFGGGALLAGWLALAWSPVSQRPRIRF